MGLDMYAFKAKSVDIPATPVFSWCWFNGQEIPKLEMFFQWRKHPDLHGWMERLYRARGGDAEDFNFECVVLNPEDINLLERDVTLARLPHTEGFFFGESVGDPEEIGMDVQFIRKAREAHAEGLSVFYMGDW